MINSPTHQINPHIMPPPAHTTPMPNTLNNLHAPSNAAGRDPQLTAAPPPGEINENTPPKKRANICIATLNVNGAATQNMDHKDKWSTINSTMKAERIAILALQETHLDEELLGDINSCFGKNLKIINSSTPDSPQTTAGVAIVLNKALIAPTSIKTHILKQGRAMAITLKWSSSKERTIMNVYAPNERDQHPAFWAQIELERRAKRIPNPDFVLGDFNVTEDEIDRSPPQENERIAIDALREMRQTWEIQDQWRYDNPSGRAFTHKHINRARKYEYARLDRIYSARRHANTLFEWRTRQSAVPTDHWLVSVKFAPRDAPLIGGGRWTWPLSAVNDEPLIKKIIKDGITAQIEIEEITNTPVERRTKNLQMVWSDFKTKIQKATKKEHRRDNYRIKSKIRDLEKDIKTITDEKEIDEDDWFREEIAFLTNELAHLNKKLMKDQRETMRAQLAHHGERPGGIWTAINKQKKPRDLIPRLRIQNTDPPQYERSTIRMAELAKTYHENLQQAGINDETEAERTAQIKEALAALPEEQQIDEPTRTRMAWKVESTQVERSP